MSSAGKLEYRWNLAHELGLAPDDDFRPVNARIIQVKKRPGDADL